MSDTPRTKAAIQIFGDYIRSEPAVPVDFAEELEVELSDAKTELAEARAELERLKRSWDSWALKMWLNIGEKESDYPCTTKAIARLEKDMERKGKLIEQMSEALAAAKNDGKMQSAITYQLIRAALSAAERINK